MSFSEKLGQFYFSGQTSVSEKLTCCGEQTIPHSYLLFCFLQIFFGCFRFYIWKSKWWVEKKQMADETWLATVVSVGNLGPFLNLRCIVEWICEKLCNNEEKSLKYFLLKSRHSLVLFLSA